MKEIFKSYLTFKSKKETAGAWSEGLSFFLGPISISLLVHLSARALFAKIKSIYFKFKSMII